jgi:hypothetical protein
MISPLGSAVRLSSTRLQNRLDFYFCVGVAASF